MKPLKIIFALAFALSVSACSPLHITMKDGVGGQDGNAQADFSDRAYIESTGASSVASIDGEPTRNFFEFIAGFFQYTTSVDIESGKREAVFKINKSGYHPVFARVIFDAEKGGRYQFVYDWSYSSVKYSLLDMKTKKRVPSAVYK